jgi:hypothetical protein
MAPEEICRRLGEPKIKSMFLSLTTDGMKKIMTEGNLSTKRGAREITSAQRNQAFADRFWRQTAATGNARACATLLYEFFVRHRRPLLAEFLTTIGVPHDDGLTDADFMKDVPEEKLLEAGKKLLAHHDPQDVAAYLLFLDATCKTPMFHKIEKIEDSLAPAAEKAAATP